MCSFAYAISQQGARKLLHALSIDGLHMAFDNSLASLCRDAASELVLGKSEGLGLRCLSINPTIMFHHRAKGPAAADSDIQDLGGVELTRDRGVTESVRYSVRLNMKNIITGKPLQDQFSED